MALGSTLIYQGFKKSMGSRTGFSLMAIAGLGTVLVGVFPENINSVLHGFGAILAFALGNMSLVVLANELDMPKFLKYFTVLLGSIGLLSLALLALKIYLNLGEGGVERLTAYPQTIWLIVFGIYISAHRFRVQRLKHKS